MGTAKIGRGDMEYRRLGQAGLRVSAFGLGGWLTFGGSVRDERTVSQVLRAAFDAGVNFFDIADIYARGEAEVVMGRVLRDLPRHELVVSTKLFWPMSEAPNDRGLSRKHVMESIDRSLQRLGMDHVDVYFCHRFDPDTPVEETARAMDDLIHQGKVLYWGTSEWTGAQLHHAQRLCGDGGLYRPAVEQPQYSLVERTKFERDVRPAAVEHGMGLVTWSPLASGLLTGKYDESVPAGSRLDQIDWLRESVRTPANVERVREMGRLAEELGCSRTHLALAWVLGQPAVSSVILGATNVEQLRENLGASGVTLDDRARARLDEIFPPG
jgi:voltage-dependent potassium channel beta subunit